MEVKTFTYEKMAGSYYLKKFFSSQRMEEHIAELLKQGWEIMTPPTPGAKGRSKGIGLPGDTMVVVFKKD
jgi:hypothetical protein